ncbi:hypothetical protein [Naasia sp. SYSU D00057]|nr:hypothetical protein [Naasia sp. SYSU D00057]
MTAVAPVLPPIVRVAPIELLPALHSVRTYSVPIPAGLGADRLP